MPFEKDAANFILSVHDLMDLEDSQEVFTVYLLFFSSMAMHDLSERNIEIF